MNRRRFLSWLTGTAAGVALAPSLDVEKLLWTPGEKSIFLPLPAPPTVQQIDWYYNCSLLSPDAISESARAMAARIDELILREYLAICQKSVGLAARVNRDYERHWHGDAVKIRLPQRWVPRSLETFVAPPQGLFNGLFNAAAPLSVGAGQAGRVAITKDWMTQSMVDDCRRGSGA